MMTIAETEEAVKHLQPLLIADLLEATSGQLCNAGMTIQSEVNLRAARIIRAAFEKEPTEPERS